jgi:transcriptional regulator with XRE-family HTH domain
MILDNKLIGKRIKELRCLNYISQMELAEKSDISDTYLSLIESGKKRVSLETLIKVANALDTSADTLLTGNLKIDRGNYESELADIMKDCSHYEKRVIYEVIRSLKDILRQNKAIIEDELINNI